MTSNDYAEEMRAQGGYEPRLPVHVLTGEATMVASFVRQFWKPSEDGSGQVIPGLESAGKKLSPNIAEEILELVELCQKANNDYYLAREVNLSAEKFARADFLEAEMLAALEWHFDDGVTDDSDAQLEAIRQSPAMISESIDAKASSLSQLAALAGPHRSALEGLGGFKSSWIDEAQALAAELRAVASPSGPQTERMKAALQKRNALLAVLSVRVNLVRSAARFIYRAHPAIAKKATSAYERNRRNALQRKKAAPTVEVA